MRNEYIKFLDTGVNQIESELICGPRSTSVEACDDRKNELIKKLIIGELEQSHPLGSETKYFIKATETSQSGVHQICITPHFEIYPDFKVNPYSLTVSIKPNDGFNNEPFWNSDFEAL